MDCSRTLIYGLSSTPIRFHLRLQSNRLTTSLSTEPSILSSFSLAYTIPIPSTPITSIKKSKQFLENIGPNVPPSPFLEQHCTPPLKTIGTYPRARYQNLNITTFKDTTPKSVQPVIYILMQLSTSYTRVTPTHIAPSAHSPHTIKSFFFSFMFSILPCTFVNLPPPTTSNG
jgi:hypothetical protein